jgi:hypothetical protein
MASKGRSVGPLDAMARKQKEAQLYARVEPDQHKRIKGLIAAAGGTQNQFVHDAVLEKLERGGVATTDVGVLRGLSTEDRDTVQWIADLLRNQAGNTLLRDVLHAQRSILLLLMRST